MNPRRASAFLFAALALLACAPVSAQLSAYQFEPAKVPVGKVFHYEKSMLDGSHATCISVYVAGQDRIEALKWDRGGDEATLVLARLDWSKFSVQRFDAWYLARDAVPELRATLDVNGEEMSMSLMNEPVKLSHWPWHSYDFDFTSLNLTLPHLRDPEADLAFWRTDFVYADPPVVAEIGEIRLHFERNERRAGKAVRRYSLGGAGLQDTRGYWWADIHTGLLVEYEMPVGDEPGYDNVRVKLSGSEQMSSEDWEVFKRAAVGAK
jgi:hypothetical protein